MITALKDKILPCIEDLYTSTQFDVNALVSELGISAGYLGEITLRKFGMSPRILIETVRLDKVIDFLESAVSLVIISTSCGFGNYKTFRSAFVRRIGVSAASARSELHKSKAKIALKNTFRMNLWFEIKPNSLS